MRGLLVVVSLTACGGGGGPTIPRGRPSVQLVRCLPATPPPQATDTLEAAGEERRRSGPSGRIVVGKKPAVSFGAISTDGVISPADVTTVARTKQPNMLACFGLASSLTRLGVIYKFTIGSDGSVGQVETTSSGLGGAIDGCLRGAFRSLKFPVRGATTAVTFPLIYDSTGTFAVPEKPEALAIEPDPWTPFAVDNRAITSSAAGAARATEAAMRNRVAAIDKCFANPASTGSLRILLDLDITGELSAVRAGGIGDKDAEICAAKSLAGLKVMTPSQEHVEISCDLSRGDAAPWRVSPAAGYEVIDVDARGLKHGTEMVVPGVSEPEPLPAETYVVVARPDTLGGMLQLSLMWARDATAVLLSVGDGKAAPVFLGMGNASPTEEDGEALRPAIRVGRQFATGCVGRATHKASITSSTELGGLMQKLSARCRTLRCAPTMVIAIDSDARASDLLEVAGAARRSGFDRVLFGGAELGCTAEPKKRDEDLELAPDFE